MGRHNKIEVFRKDKKYSIRYFWNREQYVLAKNPSNRFSFYPVDEIYIKDGYNILQLTDQESKSVINKFEKKKDTLIGKDTDIERVDSRYFIQHGYIKDVV